MQFKPHGYQKYAAEHIKNNPIATLFLDMGLGKTFQIISFLCDRDIRKKVGKVLIVVPKSLLTNWVKEFEKFGFCKNVNDVRPLF